MAIRRRKDSSLRDVASMLRSFNYAAETALNHFSLDQSYDCSKLEPEVRRWEAVTSAAFVNGYDSAGEDNADDADTLALLQFFTFEKALSELNYELNNRPEWVHLPVRGLLQLMAGKN